MISFHNTHFNTLAEGIMISVRSRGYNDFSQKFAEGIMISVRSLQQVKFDKHN